MSVKINYLGQDENEQPVFVAYDQDTNNEVPVKNWFEKSKNKWHIVLGPNSANRKYIAHNEFFTKAVNDEYIVEDKTTGPRTLGTAQPDKKLVPFMTEEEKVAYDAIIARAIERRNAEKVTKAVLTEEEKLERQIEKLKQKLARIQDK